MKLKLYLGSPVMKIPIYLFWPGIIFLLVSIGSATTPLTELARWIIVFILVTIHELAHCWASFKTGHSVDNITLIPPIGGIANLRIERITPQQERFISLCGPATNLVFIILAQVIRVMGLTIPGLNFFFMVNIALFIFNILPLFPLDGGRVLRSLLVETLHDYAGATKIAWYISLVGFIILLAFSGFHTNLLIIAAVLLFFGWTEVFAAKKGL